MAATKSAKDSLDNLYVGGAIVNLGVNKRIAKKVRTKRPSLDYVTDGGFPIGRLILFAGEKSSGKSSAAIQLAPLLGDKILYVDTEYTLTSDYIETLGCDPSNFYHVMPQSTEEMCDIIRANVKDFDVIIIDSINNSASMEQLNKKSEEKTMANRATVLTAQLPIIVGDCNRHNTTLFVISQIRQNMQKQNKYDPDTVIPGGESLHHNSSMTLEFFSSTKVKDDGNEFDGKETVTGRTIRVLCSKNKVGEPFRTIKMEFLYKEGYTEDNDVIDAALKLGIIENKGAWFYYKDLKFNGRGKVRSTFKENKVAYKELMAEVEDGMEKLLKHSAIPILVEDSVEQD